MNWLPIALSGLLSTAAATQSLPPIEVTGWAYAGESATSVMFVKPDAAPKKSPYARMLVRFEEAVPFERDGFASMSNIEINDVDCAGHRTRTVSNLRYPQRNMQGAPHAVVIKSPAWRVESDGSFGAAILNAACGEASGGAV